MSQWVDRYIPKTLDEYVWSDPIRRSQVEKWIAAREVPHALLSGIPGTGKSSLALMILRLIGIPDEDILMLNASKYRLVDGLETMLGDFMSTIAFNDTGIKYVILNEADKLSDTSQGMLRDEMEANSSVCRVIMTCNRDDKISEALKSRCQHFTFTAIDRESYDARLLYILEDNKIVARREVFDQYASSCYPDLRKAIGLMELYSVDGELVTMPEEVALSLNFMAEAIASLLDGKVMQARNIIVANCRPDDYGDIYRFLYTNIDLFGKDEYEQGSALLVIRDAIVNHEIVADQEINLAACLCELMRKK